jgi:hypothetical protein
MEHTVLEWLTLLEWQVEVDEEAGVLHGTATRSSVNGRIQVEARSTSLDSLAWALLQAATVALESSRRRPIAAAA